jgi:glucose-6-phosphate 1-dehydrogenase
VPGVQNMLIMRFSNPFLSAVWNRASIDNIQIVMKEDFGTQGRGGYFDSYGIIRDVIQNHLLQVRRRWTSSLLVQARTCFVPSKRPAHSAARAV